MQVKQWAREHNVPPSTVYDALERGRITRTADGLDPVDAAAWLRSRKDRISEDQAADAGRQQVLDAMVAEAATDIQRLRRQLLELRQTTVATDDAARAARGRRWARLQAALASVPAVWNTAEVAAAVQRPPQAVHKALAKFVERVIRDLGGLTEK